MNWGVSWDGWMDEDNLIKQIHGTSFESNTGT